MGHKKWKKKTRSDGRGWDGFRPAEYKLSDLVWKLPIYETLVNDPSSEGVTRTPTTVGEAFKTFNGSGRMEGERFIPGEGVPILEIESPAPMLGGLVNVITASGDEREIDMGPEGYGLTVESSRGKHCFSGTEFSVELLGALLRLRKAGNNPFQASWFPYDSDSATKDPSDYYVFFVVCGDKIVDERIVLSDSLHNGFDPAIFSAGDDGEPLWFAEEGWQEARVAMWYRRFYAETRTGQLMVLRPDLPELYFYPEARFASARLEGLLGKANALLVALVIISALVLIRLMW